VEVFKRITRERMHANDYWAIKPRLRAWRRAIPFSMVMPRGHLHSIGQRRVAVAMLHGDVLDALYHRS